MTPSLYSFSYVCARCGISPRTLRRYIQEGLVAPSYTDEGVQAFDEAALERIEIIRRLRCDLGVNLAGIDIILRLTSRIRELKDQVERLKKGMDDGARSAEEDLEDTTYKIIGKRVINIDIYQD